ncbi:hypothetical protein LCGC14_0446670 [marine sediment metagenome]|uniref:Uncharacterized protein n=1 Tax=marine sediment metagenome TaxID=412755 RepID=A0A0F9V5T5_9ZZZZ
MTPPQNILPTGPDGDPAIKIEIYPDHIVFEGNRHDFEDLNTNIAFTVILDGLPMSMKLAYQIVYATNQAYRETLHKERQRIIVLETRIADQAAELQLLRGDQE